MFPMLSFIKASAALALSDIPWNGPIGQQHTMGNIFLNCTYLGTNIVVSMVMQELYVWAS